MKTKIIIILLLGVITALIMIRVYRPSDKLLEGMVMKTKPHAPYETVIIFLLVGVVAALIMLRGFRPSDPFSKKLVTEPTDPRQLAAHETTTHPPRPSPAASEPAGGPDKA